MKKLNKILTVALLVCFSAFALVGLTACGASTKETLANNFEKIETIFAEQSQVFATGDCDGLQTKYLVNYGDKVNSQVGAEKTAGESLYGYLELETQYNKMLAISMGYIDEHKDYLLALSEQASLAKEVEKSLQNLNKSMETFFDEFNLFVEKRNDMVDRFRRVGGSATDNASLAYMRRFKKEYGKFLQKNIEISSNIAKTVESTGVFALMKETGMTAENTQTVKDYVGVKMLPIFYGFMIEKIENQIYWKATPDTADKTMVDGLLAKAEDCFEGYISNFIDNNGTPIALDANNTKMFFDLIDAFFAETEAYNLAIDGFDFVKLAGECENVLSEYAKKNALAETFIAKIKQFFEFSVEKFMNEFIWWVY